MNKNAWIDVAMVIHDSNCMGPSWLFYPALPNLMNTLVSFIHVKANKKSRYECYENHETEDAMQWDFMHLGPSKLIQPYSTWLLGVNRGVICSDRVCNKGFKLLGFLKIFDLFWQVCEACFSCPCMRMNGRIYRLKLGQIYGLGLCVRRPRLISLNFDV